MVQLYQIQFTIITYTILNWTMDGKILKTIDLEEIKVYVYEKRRREVFSLSKEDVCTHGQNRRVIYLKTKVGERTLI